MKLSLMEYLLNELTIDVDPNDPNSLTNVKQSINQAKRNPSAASRQSLKNTKDALSTAQKAENSPTKALDVKIARMKQQIATLQQQKERISSRPTTESYIVEDLCEIVYTDEHDNIVHEGSILSESAIQAFKRTGNVIKRQFRCTSGRKEGKVVANANECNKRKNPKKVKAGRKAARKNKASRIQKTKVAKQKSISKMVTSLNKKLRG
ncbi:MAG: hypothetical protein KAJ73_03765 [Zetaproteobacteria bacterium]|nr:hypothetical protein [Zetaproteobacteria bacterium]